MSSFEESDPSEIVVAEDPTPPAPIPATPPLYPQVAASGSWEIRHIDGTVLAEIAGIAMNKRIRRRLNRPAECTFRVPSYLVNDVQFDGRPLICAGYRRLSVTLDCCGLFFHGTLWNVEDDGDEDMIYTQVTCYDPMIMWRYRPARDDVDSYTGEAGNLIDPSFIERNQFGGPIMQEILTASEGLTNPARIPTLAEGQLMIDLANSTFAGGGADLTGAPTNWPMTIAEIASILTNTGELDIVMTPIIGSIGADGFQNMAEVHTFTGDYGDDLTGTVHFDYAIGDHNARLLRRVENMDTIGNKIFYYLGPRLDQKHWRSNVTRDHPGLGSIPSFPELDNLIDESRAFLGVYMLQNIYDNFGSGSGASGTGEFSAYPLFLRQFMVESLLRMVPRNMVYITPVRNGEFGVGDFDIGDLITINIGAKSRKAESGAQRIYAYTVEVDDDGVESLGEFESSPDQDSI